MNTASALSALLDPARLAIAGALVGASRTTAELEQRTGLGRDDVLRAVGALRQAGLVEQEGDGYTLPVATLRTLADRCSEAELPMDPYIGYGMGDDERQVLSRFFQGRTLIEIPSNRAKRLVVLERIALEFDLGRHYGEDEVDEVLRAFHPDHVTLRRYLVDEGLLDRDRGEYWRSGDRYPGGSGSDRR